MSGVEDTGTPGTQQDEKKPLDGAGGGHINLKVKGQVTASLLSSRLISSRELLFVQGFLELARGFGCGSGRCRWGFCSDDLVMLYARGKILSREFRLSFFFYSEVNLEFFFMVWRIEISEDFESEI
jgi:hypothetical protein